MRLEITIGPAGTTPASKSRSEAIQVDSLSPRTYADGIGPGSRQTVSSGGRPRGGVSCLDGALISIFTPRRGSALVARRARLLWRKIGLGAPAPGTALEHGGADGRLFDHDRRKVWPRIDPCR